MAKKPKNKPADSAPVAAVAPAYVGKVAVERWRSQGVEAVTAAEVALALRMTPEGVRGLPIPYTSIGQPGSPRAERRYSVDEVERYLQANTKAAS